jgi:excisionase family DNA binding protein
MDEVLWKVDDIADQFRVPKTWVYAKAEAGVLPSVRLGRYVRFEPSAVRQWFAEQRKPAR